MLAPKKKVSPTSTSVGEVAPTFSPITYVNKNSNGDIISQGTMGAGDNEVIGLKCDSSSTRNKKCFPKLKDYSEKIYSESCSEVPPIQVLQETCDSLGANKTSQVEQEAKASCCPSITANLNALSYKCTPENSCPLSTGFTCGEPVKEPMSCVARIYIDSLLKFVEDGKKCYVYCEMRVAGEPEVNAVQYVNCGGCVVAGH